MSETTRTSETETQTAPCAWTVRVDVDTQNGFCHPDGGLFVEGADAILGRVAALNREAVERGYALVGSVDSHDYASAEFQQNGGPWPVHCVKGTWGWLKPAETLPERLRIVGREPVDIAAAFDDGRAALYLEKDRYSLFDNVNAGPLLALLRQRARAEGRELVFEVYGVATDVCVKAAALGLIERGERVRVLLDACRAVTEEGGEAAIRAMEAAGIELVAGERTGEGPG